jgi:hypothetical protein
MIFLRKKFFRFSDMTNHEFKGPAKMCYVQLKSTCDVNLLSKLSIIFKEWRVMNNVDRGGVIVLFVL